MNHIYAECRYLELSGRLGELGLGLLGDVLEVPADGGSLVSDHVRHGLADLSQAVVSLLHLFQELAQVRVALGKVRHGGVDLCLRLSQQVSHSAAGHVVFCQLQVSSDKPTSVCVPSPTFNLDLYLELPHSE